jgi:hypothetical protein
MYVMSHTNLYHCYSETNTAVRVNRTTHADSGYISFSVRDTAGDVTLLFTPAQYELVKAEIARDTREQYNQKIVDIAALAMELMEGDLYIADMPEDDGGRDYPCATRWHADCGCEMMATD